MKSKRKNARAFALAFSMVILLFILIYGTLTAYARMKTAGGEYTAVAEIYMVNEDYAGINILGEDYILDRNAEFSVPTWSSAFVPDEIKLAYCLYEYIIVACDG